VEGVRGSRRPRRVQELGVVMAVTEKTTPTAETIHSALDSIVAAIRDVDGDALTECFADDAEFGTIQGTFFGKDAIREYFHWTMAQGRSADIEERGIRRLVNPPFATVEGVEDLTTTDGTRYRVPYLACGKFDADGKIVAWTRYSDRWLIYRQGAAQLKGPQGWIFRWFVRQVDSMSEKGLPTPARPPV
jgi:uncharacterized protein (TIGR02246 family)